MGKPDVSLKVWLGNPTRFADLFNAILFKGKHIIDASELETEKNEYDMIVTDKSNIPKALQSFRDIVMRWNNEFTLVILACENQESINYGMPVRNMIYDGMAYSEQIQQISNKINADSSNYKNIPDIYYSHKLNFHKLSPVITLVLYYGNDEWDAPIELYDMLDIDRDSCKDEDVMEVFRQYVPNYRINLVVPWKIEDYSMFSTDLHIIFHMLKYKHNKVKLEEYVKKYSSYFANIPLDTMNAIKILLKTGKRFDKKLEEFTKKKKERKEEGKETYNFMCVFDEIYEDGVAQGVTQGVTQGAKVIIESIIAILSFKGKVSGELIKRIKNETNIELLGQWIKKAIEVTNVEDFEKEIFGVYSN